MKICWASLYIREIQIKTTMRYCFIPVRMAIIKMPTNKCWWGCGGKRTLVNCWWDCKLVQAPCKTIWSFLKKLKIKLPYNLTILLLGIFLKERKALIWKDTCSPMFIAALLSIAKIRKQARCSSIDTWATMMWYLYTLGYYLAIKWIKSCLCDNMNGSRGYYAKWHKSDKD